MATESGSSTVAEEPADETKTKKESYEGPRVKSDAWPRGLDPEQTKVAGEIAQALLAGEQADRRVQGAFSLLRLTRYLHQLAAAGLSQQLELLGHDELVEQILRSSASDFVKKLQLSRSEVLDILTNDGLPFVAAECELERERLLAEAQAERAEREKDRRQLDIPIGLALTDAMQESMQTTVPRGHVVYLDSRWSPAVKAVMYDICSNVLRTRQHRVLFLRNRDSLQGNDFAANKKADGLLALVPESTWRSATESGNAWAKLMERQGGRLRDGRIDCVVIEDLLADSRGRASRDIRQAVAMLPHLVRWAKAEGAVVIVGASPAVANYEHDNPPIGQHADVTAATLHSIDQTPQEFVAVRRIATTLSQAVSSDPDSNLPLIAEYDLEWFQDPQLLF